MKKTKLKKLKRLLLKLIWFSLIAVLAIILWVAIYALFSVINQPSDSWAIPAVVGTVLLLITFISLYVFVSRKSKKTLLRWTGKSLIILCPLMVLCAIPVALSGNNGNNKPVQTVIQRTVSFDSANALNLLNLERAQAGAVPLSKDGTLDQAATNLASDMVANNYRAFEGRDPWTFVNNTGYPYNYASFFFNDVSTNETDFVKSVLANPNVKSYINGKQFLFVGIGTAQKDKASPILAVVYLIEPPKVGSTQTGSGYKYTSSPINLPSADYGQARPLELPDINPDDYRSPNSTPYQYKPPKTYYPKPDNCHVYEYFC